MFLKSLTLVRATIISSVRRTILTPEKICFQIQLLHFHQFWLLIHIGYDFLLGVWKRKWRSYDSWWQLSIDLQIMTTSTWLRCLGPTIVILDWLSWSWKDYLAAINAKCQLEATMLPLHRIRIRITCNSCWKTWRIVLRFCRILGRSCCWISNSLAAGLTPPTNQFPSCLALLQGSPKDFLTILYLYFDYCAKDQFSLPDDDSQIFNQVILGHGR